jgi:hypothetical protein
MFWASISKNVSCDTALGPVESSGWILGFHLIELSHESSSSLGGDDLLVLQPKLSTVL